MKSPKQITLGPGKHSSPAEGVCLMEAACIASGQATFSDLPACTNEAVARFAQRVWDLAPADEYRALVERFLMRLMRARRTGNDLAVNRRLALFAARKVEHLHPAAKACNDVTERFLDGEATVEELREARAAAAAADAAAYDAADAYDAAAAAADAAAYAAYADAVDAAHDQRVAMLDALLDHHEKLLADTPEGIYVPTEWEQAAIDFVEELCGEQA